FLNGQFPDTTPGVATGNYTTEDAFPNLTFDQPIFLCQEPGSNRLFVGEKKGVIVAFDHDPNANTKTQVINLQAAINSGGESGLQSFAFHPQYPDSNYLYVFYQTSNSLHSRVSRFTINPTTDVATNGSEMILINQKDPQQNHNGGSIFFDKEGYLYVSFGDGGGQNNPHGHGQSLTNELLGGVLRIDVDRDPTRSHPILRQPGTGSSYTQNYFIPDDNPWLDPAGGLLEEFFALGLRNPYRMTYDSLSGAIILGDVGQNAREEVDWVTKGANFDWSHKEGTINGPDAVPGNYYGTSTDPIYEYQHNGGQSASVIGGYVYRGTVHPDLVGSYVFGDYNSRKIWKMENPLGGSPVITELLTLTAGGSLCSFAVDQAQELYILEFSGNGSILRLTKQNPGAPEPPALLSQVGAFTDLNNLTPADFMVPYSMNQPFWSDGAIKSRWLIVPNNGTHNTANEQITFASDGSWDWPDGTVLVKHFDYPMDETNPSVTRKLETRFMIKQAGGGFYGVTYRWRDDQSDADLLSTQYIDTLNIATASGNRTVEWLYPSRGDCMSCHNSDVGGSLGLRAGQQNGDQLYPSTGVTANQLKTLTHLNMFMNPPDTSDLSTEPVIAGRDDLSFTLEERARGYLESNCASCHFGTHVPAASFDTRVSVDLLDAGLLYGEVSNDIGVHDSRVLVPGDAEASVLYQRILQVHEDFAMPPLAKNLMDTVGVQLIADWLNSVAPNVAGGAGLTYQRIDFAAVPEVMNTADGPLTLNATATSGLPINFQLVSGPATLAGNTLTLNGTPGRVILRAVQAGNGTFEPAPEKEQVIQVSPPGVSVGTGLLGTYYNNANLTNQAFTQTDAEIDFSWGSGSPAISMAYDSYSIKWEGMIEPLTSETYTFFGRSDDGIRLWINNQLVIDNWQDQGVNEVSGTISLTAFTQVPIRVEFYENSVYAQARLSWSAPSVDKAVIPSYALYPVTGQVLPVEGLRFTAVQAGNQVQLDWETLLEVNTSTFVIERSADGQSFEAIGEVAAAGNSSELTTYQQWDEEPLVGLNAYRLKQIDLNGAFSYSALQEVWFKEQEDWLKVQLFPNPLLAGERLQIVVEADNEQVFQLQLMDMSGRVLRQETHRGQRNYHIQMDRSDLAAGLYLVRIRKDKREVIERVLLN
ncbi:MAG: PQQ-dependent sugar dehydrogenase, partial [Bacteroidota bacterium]